jgi:hypothetical protein
VTTASTSLQAVVVSQAELTNKTTPLRIALFNEDGSPFDADQTDMVPAATQAAFAGADITALKVELNAFLTKLKTAGIVLSS